MKKALIVAKHKEDIEWLKDARLHGIDIKLYNKGPIKKGDKGMKLKNVGREAHTYLHHIAKNYDNLADVNIFTQGNPFDHCPDFLDKLDNCGKGYYDLGGKTIKNRIDRESVTRAGAEIWGENIAPIVFDILIQHGPPLVRKQLKNEGSVIVGVNYYAIFSVDRETIHKFPKSFYEKLLGLTIDSAHGPYIMEFLWGVLYA